MSIMGIKIQYRQYVSILVKMDILGIFIKKTNLQTHYTLHMNIVYTTHKGNLRKVIDHTFFISCKVLMVLVCSQLAIRSRTLSSIMWTMPLMAEGRNEDWICFLRWEWYEPCWKKMAWGPSNISLLIGYVGLKRWDWVTRMILAISGLDIITLGHPNMWLLNIFPYLHDHKLIKNIY